MLIAQSVEAIPAFRIILIDPPFALSKGSPVYYVFFIMRTSSKVYCPLNAQVVMLLRQPSFWSREVRTASWVY